MHGTEPAPFAVMPRDKWRHAYIDLKHDWAIHPGRRDARCATRARSFFASARLYWSPEVPRSQIEVPNKSN